jgi:peptide/nickel transport system substrate-binding protein
MATLIRADLKPLGILVDVSKLEQHSLVDRVIKTRNYDAAILALASADADPNADINVWLSSGGSHVWNPGQAKPATPWEAEIDGLMRKQLVTRSPESRKALFDRVQEIAMEHMPLIPLVSPHVLVGAKKRLGNFRPALLEPYALWNVEELYWQAAGGGTAK